MDTAVVSVIGVTVAAALGAVSVLGSKAIEAATARKTVADQRTKDERAARDELRGDNDRLEAKNEKLELRLERRQLKIFEQEQQIVKLQGDCSSSGLRLEIAIDELAKCKKMTRAEVRKELFNGSDG